MRTIALRYAILMILAMTANVVGAQDLELPVSDIQDSGCTRESDTSNGEDQVRTIVLEKEGNILSVQLLNYTSRCGTDDFEVNPSIHEGDAGDTSTLLVEVIPHGGQARCLCPYNVSFTISDLEPNSFYLKCWWFEGMVELTEGEQLVLKDIWENVSIDGADYALHKTLRHATLKKCGWAGEVSIPTELSYEGNTYSVTSVGLDAFTGNTALTKVFIPQTIKDFGISEVSVLQRNMFVGCTALEYIEVEEGNPVFCSVDGVLFDKEKSSLYTYPAAEEVRLSSNLTALPGLLFSQCEHLKSVTIPQGVTNLGLGVFAGCASLTSITMPESVVSTEYAVFEDCTSLSEVTLSPNLKEINQKLFLNCSSLAEIQIPEGVTCVLSNAFENCLSLKKIDLPGSVDRFGKSPFSGCKLDSLLIRGLIEHRWITTSIFEGMGTETKLYVRSSQVGIFRTVYKGPVYPLPSQTDGVSNIVGAVDVSSELFDLQGRKLHGKPAKGVYIQDGKKQIVK